MSEQQPAKSSTDSAADEKAKRSSEYGTTDVTFFGQAQYQLALTRIDHYFKQNGKKELSDVIYEDAKALSRIDFKGVQEFKERLRDAFRAAGKRGAEAYAKAVYEEMTDGTRKFGISAYLTTNSLPNDPSLKPGEYGKFFFITINGDKLELPF
jgi:hypothetical protein